MRLAAIDIGSNAARLLITEVIKQPGQKPSFNKLNLVRVPLRLGFDVFEYKKILPEKAGMIISTMHSYKHMLTAYGVTAYKACATSAMRDAENSAAILEQVEKETGIHITVISGDEEASVIYENHVAENAGDERPYLYIDVGGGSTELTLFNSNEMAFKQSFDIGTIRLLKKQVTEEQWSGLKNFCREKTRPFRNLVTIGTGGNINKIFSMSKRKDGKSLPLDLLKDYYKEFNSVPLYERMRIYDLREDRADVVVPALLIFMNVMRWSEANEIFVPKIGLADGIIQVLYKEIRLREVEI